MQFLSVVLISILHAMSIHLICQTAAAESGGAPAEEAGLQFLPARVGGHGDADASVDPYFDTYSGGADDRRAPTLANSLRGYPVRGDLFAMPATHFGCVFEEDKRPLDEASERTMRQRCRFSQFRLWNYDQRPSRNDGLKMAVEGFCLTEEVSE